MPLICVATSLGCEITFNTHPPNLSNVIGAVGEFWQLAVAATTASPLTTSRSRLDVDLGSPPASSLDLGPAQLPKRISVARKRASRRCVGSKRPLCLPPSLPICPSQRRRKFGSKDAAAEGNGKRERVGAPQPKHIQGDSGLGWVDLG